VFETFSPLVWLTDRWVRLVSSESSSKNVFIFCMDFENFFCFSIMSLKRSAAVFFLCSKNGTRPRNASHIACKYAVQIADGTSTRTIDDFAVMTRRIPEIIEKSLMNSPKSDYWETQIYQILPPGCGTPSRCTPPWSRSSSLSG
jgi:hypothetical protein